MDGNKRCESGGKRYQAVPRGWTNGCTGQEKGPLAAGNEEKGGLGMPMPSGTVRVYQSDSTGGVQFVGEDRIQHTPKDEVLNLKIGHAFDVVCERNQVDFQKISTNVWEVEYAITLRNRKSTPITVEVNEPVGAATWRMLQSSHKYAKTAAFAAQFMVPVAAGEETVLKFRIRVNG